MARLATYAKETALTKDPLSAGEETSAITPYAIEKVPDPIFSEEDVFGSGNRSYQILRGLA